MHPHKVGLYARISQDTEGEGAGVERQIHDAEKLADLRDWEVAEHYVDNDVSAYKKGVVRPRFEQMLRDLQAGKIDGLVVYDLDRLARQPRDLERVIDLYDERALVYASVTAEINLATPDGRVMARVMVAFANKSSSDTARRVERKHLELAEQGKPVGGFRPFGWADDRLTLHPVEAPAMRKVVADLLAGRSLRSAVRWLNDHGHRTSAGGEWKHQTLRQYLRNPRLAGLRVHRGQVLHSSDGKPVAGLWEPLVDREDHDRLLLVLDAKRQEGRSEARRYLLSGVLRCGVCNGPMYGNSRGEGRGHYYHCAGVEAGDRHTLSISGKGADRLVGELVRRSIAGERLDAAPKSVWAGEAGLARVETSIADLMRSFREGVLSSETVFPQVRALEQERDQMRENRAQWLAETTGPVVSSLTPEVWDELDTDQRREVIGARLDAVLVKRPTIARRFEPDRLVPVWKRRG